MKKGSVHKKPSGKATMPTGAVGGKIKSFTPAYGNGHNAKIKRGK